MNVNWLAPIMCAAFALVWLSLPIRHYLAGLQMDGYAPGLGLMMGGIWCFLAAFTTRQLLRRKGQDG